MRYQQKLLYLTPSNEATPEWGVRIATTGCVLALLVLYLVLPLVDNAEGMRFFSHLNGLGKKIKMN